MPAVRVLVVDDDAAVLRSLERLLTREGFTVRSTTRCSEALDALDDFAPDVIIADFRMPEMDGRQLLATIRSRRPRVARLLISGFTELQSLPSDDPVEKYLPKPWDRGRLVAEIRACVAGRER
jgi:DNA-binding NtrC family response regulator